MKPTRKDRAFKEKIFLIEAIEPDEDQTELVREYRVMGNSGNLYTVTIQANPKCTCLDFRMRQNKCKHLYFILMRVMKVNDENKKTYTKKDLQTMFNNIPPITRNLMINKAIQTKYEKMCTIETTKTSTFVEQKPITETDLCPICLDSLLGGELDYCKDYCGNSIHQKCFKMWCKQNKPICVFCRGDWNFAVVKKKNNITKEKSIKSNGKINSKKKLNDLGIKSKTFKLPKVKGYINLLGKKRK